MSNCTSGCPAPGTHRTWGECLRAKAPRIGWAHSAVGADLTAQKKWDSRLQEYRAARRQGIQPDSTQLEDVRRAVQLSNDAGVAYRADAL
jgi:uncharacterized membrane-anchored protein